MKIKILVLASIVLSVIACEPTSIDTPNPVGEVDGVRPIYAEIETWDKITTLPAQNIQNLGKIYYKDQFIYVNERNRGIHIINNMNPKNPFPVHFVQVLGSEDIAIKGNFLYVDNVTDLVVLDISNMEDIKEVNRVKNLYPDSRKNPFPEGYTGFFECVDEAQGIVIGWEETILNNPACWR